VFDPSDGSPYPPQPLICFDEGQVKLIGDATQIVRVVTMSTGATVGAICSSNARGSKDVHGRRGAHSLDRACPQIPAKRQTTTNRNICTGDDGRFVMSIVIPGQGRRP